IDRVYTVSTATFYSRFVSFFNVPAITFFYTLSLHDALPISFRVLSTHQDHQEDRHTVGSLGPSASGDISLACPSVLLGGAEVGRCKRVEYGEDAFAVEFGARHPRKLRSSPVDLHSCRHTEPCRSQ